MTIKIPVIKNPYVISALLALLIGWFLGVLALTKLIFMSFSTWVEIGIVAITLVWVFIGLFLFRTLFWMLVGKEIIELNNSFLRTRKPLVLYRRTRSYNLSEINNLNAVKEVYKKKSDGVWVDNLRPIIKFETPYKNVSFGRGITEQEAEYILLQLAASKFLNESHFSNKQLT